VRRDIGRRLFLITNPQPTGIRVYHRQCIHLT